MSQPLEVNIKGWGDFMKSIEVANDSTKQLITAALYNSTNKIQSNVRSRAPHRTGSLQRSVLATVSYPRGSVTVDESYGQYVEDGTKPHIILPKNKKALYWKGAFSPVKIVHHPGTRAQPFFKPGVEASVIYMQQQFTKVAEKLINLMAGH